MCDSFKRALDLASGLGIANHTFDSYDLVGLIAHFSLFDLEKIT